MLALNPVHLLSLLFTPETGLWFQQIVHTFIAALGTTFALHRWGRLTPLASAFGGIAYVAGGLFAVRVTAGHMTVIAALAWWPLAALSLYRATRQVPPTGFAQTVGKLLRQKQSPSQTVAAPIHFRQKLPLLAASAITHAMVILAGGPQYIAYLFYIDAVIVITSFSRVRLAWNITMAAITWTLAVLISAPQWLPAIWYMPFIGRAVASSGTTTLDLTQLPNLWLEFLMPYPFNNDLTSGHLHFKNVWETATYPGAAALVLLAAALLRLCLGVITVMPRNIRGSTPSRGTFVYRILRRADMTPLSLIALLIIALGLYMIIGAWLPGFSSFRDPTKARAVVAFAVAILSAAIINRALHWPGRWNRPIATSALILAGYAVALRTTATPESFLTLIKSFGPPFDPLARDIYDATLLNPLLALQNYKNALMWTTAFALVLIPAVLFLRRQPHIAAPALLLIAATDLTISHASSWQPRHPFTHAHPPAEVFDFITPHLEPVAAGHELPWRVILHSSIINRTHFVDGLYETLGYDPLMPAWSTGRMYIPDTAKIQDRENPNWRAPLLERIGVRFDAGSWKPAALATDRPATAPLILEVPHATLFDASRNVIAGTFPPGVHGPDLDGTHRVMPEGRPPRDLVYNSDDNYPPAPEFQEQIVRQFPPAEFTTTAPSTLRPGEWLQPVKQTRPDHWALRANLHTPTLVTLKQTWLPGWRVTIDHQHTSRPLIANNWMPAAIVPAGQHHIEFRYRPVAWLPSLILSAAGLLIATAMTLLPHRRPKPRPQKPAEYPAGSNGTSETLTGN